VLVEAHPVACLPQDAGQRSLAHLDRLPAHVAANRHLSVALYEVEPVGDLEEDEDGACARTSASARRSYAE
jgi:hypothetical protein